MVEATTQSGEQKPSVSTEISYCPHIDVYDYTRIDGTYRFSSAELEKTITLYLEQGKTRDADFMAVLTGMARKYPHMRVKFDEEGNCNITALEAKPLPVGEDPEGSKG